MSLFEPSGRRLDRRLEKTPCQPDEIELGYCWTQVPGTEVWLRIEPDMLQKRVRYRRSPNPPAEFFEEPRP